VTLKKILVVDDSELLHRMYKLVLRRYRDYGTEILHARNGSEALSVIRETTDIDLMLLDVNMPVMSGLQLLIGLRASGLLRDLKVIMVSTQGSDDDVENALDKGAVGFVTKPFTPGELHAMIDQHFTPERREKAVVGVRESSV
jgi:two-component system, chemotaxis family, chemotaxis protein CheY